MIIYDIRYLLLWGEESEKGENLWGERRTI